MKRRTEMNRPICSSLLPSIELENSGTATYHSALYVYIPNVLQTFHIGLHPFRFSSISMHQLPFSISLDKSGFFKVVHSLLFPHFRFPPLSFFLAVFIISNLQRLHLVLILVLIHYVWDVLFWRAVFRALSCFFHMFASQLGFSECTFLDAIFHIHKHTIVEWMHEGGKLLHAVSYQNRMHSLRCTMVSRSAMWARSFMIMKSRFYLVLSAYQSVQARIFWFDSLREVHSCLWWALDSHSNTLLIIYISRSLECTWLGLVGVPNFSCLEPKFMSFLSFSNQRPELWDFGAKLLEKRTLLYSTWINDILIWWEKCQEVLEEIIWTSKWNLARANEHLVFAKGGRVF